MKLSDEAALVLWMNSGWRVSVLDLVLSAIGYGTLVPR